jgi:hypothetical protein
MITKALVRFTGELLSERPFDYASSEPTRFGPIFCV